MSKPMDDLNKTLAVSYDRSVKQRANAASQNHGLVCDSNPYFDPRAQSSRPFVDGLCHSCYEIAPWFFSSLAMTTDLSPQTEFRPIGELKMASRDPNCPLCSFLFTIAAEAAALARLPGAHKSAMFALHMSSFSSMFFHADDHCWFPENGRPAVFFISPLYIFGAKARDWALRNNSCFMLTTPGRNEATTGPCARELGALAQMDLLREWVSHCERGHTHPDCNASGSSALEGFDIIDCERRELVYCPAGRQYVTLSYVWGTEPAETLGHNNRMPGNLPRLIEDAIQVTLSLGYRYLWVDRYCIPQCDEAVKSSLIQKMDKIYAESSITIIASASERPSDGLVGVSAPRTNLPRSLRTDNFRVSQLVTNLVDEVERSRWNSRGWTYQEGFLANKRLLFTQSQCYFQCGELWCTEGLSAALSTVARLNRPGHTKLAMVFPWVPHRRTALVLSTDCDRRMQREQYFVERVREYMRRELSHDTDAFDAFAGVLNYLETFAEEFLLGNIFGLPVWSPESRWSGGGAGAREALLRSLTWSISYPFEDIETEFRSDVVLARRRQGMPSWTWCGWTGGASSSFPIEWTDSRAQEGSEPDLCPETEVALGYDKGATVPWTTDGNPADLLARGKAKGSVTLLRARGWISQLVVPAGCWNDGPAGCQCGPYRLGRRTVRYLSTAAQRHGLPLMKGDYVLKVWFLSPLSFSGSEDHCWGTVMVLVSTAVDGVYERLEALCKVKMEYFTRRPSVEYLAGRFGWDWAEFEIG